VSALAEMYASRGNAALAADVHSVVQQYAHAAAAGGATQAKAVA
jgi:hypothetical protein